MHEPTACITCSRSNNLGQLCLAGVSVWHVHCFQLEELPTAREVKFSEAMSSRPCTCSQSALHLNACTDQVRKRFRTIEIQLIQHWETLRTHLATFFLLYDLCNFLVNFFQSTIMLEDLINVCATRLTFSAAKVSAYHRPGSNHLVCGGVHHLAWRDWER